MSLPSLVLMTTVTMMTVTMMMRVMIRSEDIFPLSWQDSCCSWILFRWRGGQRKTEEQSQSVPENKTLFHPHQGHHHCHEAFSLNNRRQIQFVCHHFNFSNICPHYEIQRGTINARKQNIISSSPRSSLSQRFFIQQ